MYFWCVASLAGPSFSILLETPLGLWSDYSISLHQQALLTFRSRYVYLMLTLKPSQKCKILAQYLDLLDSCCCFWLLPVSK